MKNRHRRTSNKTNHNRQDIECLYQTALHTQNSGDYAKAEQLWLGLIPCMENTLGPNHPDTANSLHNIGVLYETTSRYVEAEAFYMRSMAIREQVLGLDHLETANSLNSLATIYLETVRYAEAEDFFKRSLAIREQVLGLNHSDTANGLNNLANVYMKTGRYTEAENFFKRSYIIREKLLGSEHLDTAASLNNLAIIYNEIGRYADAENFFQRALGVVSQIHGPDHPDVARSLNNLAIVYGLTGRYAEAENLHLRSLEIRDQMLGPDHADTAHSLNNLAVVYAFTGRYAEAGKCFHRSLEIIKKLLGFDHFETATILSNLALVYFYTNHYDNAEKYHKLSLGIREQVLGSDHPDIAACLYNLAQMYEKTDRHVEAEIFYRSSLAIFENSLGLEHPSTAASLHNLAELHGKSGRYVEAENYFQRSLAIFEYSLGSYHPNTAKSLNGLATIYKVTDRLSAAVLLAKRAVNILQNVRQDLSRLGMEVLASYDATINDTYEQLSQSLIEAGNYGEAEYVMGMLKEKERFELLRRDNAPATTARSISYNDTEARLIAQMLEFGKSLSSLGNQQEVLKQIKSRTPEEELKLAAIKEQLIKVNQDYALFLDALNDSVGPVTTKAIDQETNMMIDIAELGATTAAIVTVSGAEKLHTIFVTSHGRKAFSSQISAKELGNKILTFRELLKNPDTDEFLPLAQELYRHIITPIEEELQTGGFTTILWMLDGALRLLPLAALHDGSLFLMERLQNVCITTKSKIGPQRHEQWNGLGMGVTKDYDGHAALPSVKDELDGIIREKGKENVTGILPGEILLDDHFTRKTMESHLEEGFKAVHFASHFELNPFNETLSYLLLGDGSKIRMDELRCLPTLFKGVDLVAFSACSTGLGTASTRGREVDGIGYLGEMQGAKTVMATLWPVEDKSTSMLMREFYRLREEGMTKAEALRQAQLCLLNGKFKSENGHDFTHPYFWAPFILIGNGG